MKCGALAPRALGLNKRKHIMPKKTFILGLLMAVLILPVGAKACLVSVTITATDGANTAIQTFSGDGFLPTHVIVDKRLTVITGPFGKFPEFS